MCNITKLESNSKYIFFIDMLCMVFLIYSSCISSTNRSLFSITFVIYSMLNFYSAKMKNELKGIVFKKKNEAYLFKAISLISIYLAMNSGDNFNAKFCLLLLFSFACDYKVSTLYEKDNTIIN